MIIEFEGDVGGNTAVAEIADLRPASPKDPAPSSRSMIPCDPDEFERWYSRSWSFVTGRK